MSYKSEPKSYEQWRQDPIQRAEDAAYTFGYHLIEHCRSEALKETHSARLPKDKPELQSIVAAAVDVALHNVVDLLEGFFGTKAGPNHPVCYALGVCVCDQNGEVIERIDISPSMLDLPIGYWKWKDGEFR